ncbi:MAG: hypothetical protein IJM97_00090 [Clostridia bacterium]|nr:hypothetical protein [Clostridia bacterium]
MKWFQFNSELDSYTYPIVKIVVCIFLVIITINRGHFLNFENIFITILSVVICVASILCIYISFAEIISTYENREKIRTSLNIEKMPSKAYSVDEIIFMLDRNDIIEIQILVDKKIVEIGSSSDCNVGDRHFFDKRYYIGKKEFESIDEFKTVFVSLFSNGPVKVVSIDGINNTD